MEVIKGNINHLVISPDSVQKTYRQVDTYPVPPHIRMFREVNGLQRFGGSIAPALLGIGDLQIQQQFIEGEEGKALAESDDPLIFSQSGSLLRKIHAPIHRDPQYLKDDFERKLHRVLGPAQPILSHIGYESGDIQPNWEEVFKKGTTRVHRDFWMTNIIRNGHDPVAVDWESSGIGSPYEDFAQVKLSVFSRYLQAEEQFWQAYGEEPDQQTINEYAKLLILKRFSMIDVDMYKQDTYDRYYERLTGVLLSL